MPVIHAVQLDIRWHDKSANYRAVDALVSGQTVVPGSIIVLPEMFDVGFTMHPDVATDEPQRLTQQYLAGLAKRLNSTVIAGVVANDESGRPANHAIVVGCDGVEVGRYAKCRPFTPSGEHVKYARGQAVRVFDIDGIKIAPLICYDLRFPELFRDATRQGAELFVVIANWPDKRIAHWPTLASARAIENLAALVAVNRTGADPTLRYSGGSAIIDPLGQIVAKADDREQILSASVDIDAVRDWRRDFPALRDAGLA